MGIAIQITARLKSTRLKEKVLRPILGRPMLSHMIERLRLAKVSDTIILCTSTVEQDDRLCELAASENIHCYRGDPDDVLDRMLAAAIKYNVDTIISCTADNPFVDPLYIDKLVDFHFTGEYDFSCSEGLPFGTFAYAISRDALERACKIKNTKDTEVWGGYFTETGLFKCGTLKVTDKTINWPSLRLTVDTLEDFTVITEIFKKLYNPEKLFTLEDIVNLCREDPRIIKINQNIIQAAAKPIILKEFK